MVTSLFRVGQSVLMRAREGERQGPAEPRRRLVISRPGLSLPTLTGERSSLNTTPVNPKRRNFLKMKMNITGIEDKNDVVILLTTTTFCITVI